jgi:hypothetical protein
MVFILSGVLLRNQKMKLYYFQENNENGSIMLNELNQFYKDKYPIFYTYVEFRGCRT